jgi:hypothetical protein
MNQATQGYAGNGRLGGVSIGAGMPAPPAVVTPLQDRLQTLVDVVTSLEKRVQDLEIQLGPVLMVPVPTAAAGASEVNAAHGYVVDTLNTAIARLNQIGDALGSIQGRLVV